MRGLGAGAGAAGRGRSGLELSEEGKLTASRAEPRTPALGQKHPLRDRRGDSQMSVHPGCKTSYKERPSTPRWEG